MGLLWQQTGERRIESAIIAAPMPGNIASGVAEATRSLATFWIASNLSVTRYATFARRYSAITRPVPIAKDNGILRFGSLTSPAVNVMLFHASAENREFVCATQI